MNIKEYVELRKTQMREFVLGLTIKPHLVIIQVNDDPASNSYIRGKLKDSDQIGVNATLIKLSEETTQEELLKVIEEQNNNEDVHGLIVQMPLPKHINEEIIKLAVNPRKDVDGFHPLSTMDPCTPKGIINYLKFHDEKILGKNAVVLGRSNIVGKPMARLLLKESANVTVLHSKTTKEDMFNYIKNADIIVIAIGKKYFLNENDFEFKPSALIVDVGINRDENGLCGDAEPNLPVRLQTPVPGGVGLLTRLTLLENLLEAYKDEVSH